MKNTGLVSVSFRKLTIEEIIKLCKENNLDMVEWGSDVHAPFDDFEKLNQIVKLQSEYNISCCSYGTYFSLGVTPLSELSEYIKAAKILGTDILRIWGGNKNYEDMQDEERENFISQAKRAAEIAKANNVILCSEWHADTFTSCLDGGLRLVKEVNSPNFKTYWQPNRLRDFNTNLYEAKIIAPYTTHIHVFNWDENNCYPLSDNNGIYMWKEYLKAFSGEHKLLLEFMPKNTPEELKDEVKTLHKDILQEEIV